MMAVWMDFSSVSETTVEALALNSFISEPEESESHWKREFQATAFIAQQTVNAVLLAGSHGAGTGSVGVALVRGNTGASLKCQNRYREKKKKKNVEKK